MTGRLKTKKKNPMIFAVLIASITVAILYVLLFENRDEFGECVKFSSTPEIISAFSGSIGKTDRRKPKSRHSRASTRWQAYLLIFGLTESGIFRQDI